MNAGLTSPPPDPLQEDFFLTDAARLRRWLPWMHLGATLRMSFDPRKLILAGCALLLLSLPHLIQDHWWPPAVGSLKTPRPWSTGYLFHDPGVDIPPAEQILSQPVETVLLAASHGPQTLTPIMDVMQRGRDLIESRFRWLETTLHVVQLLWVWIVWGMFGTWICRLTALDFMGRDVGWNEAWRFCRRRVHSAVASPLLPMIGVFLFWLPCVVAGWISRIPSMGGPLVSALWVFVTVCGAVLALLLMGLALCWPLMIATIGVEGTDAFDGLSRSYNYLFSRPWYVIWMGCVVLFMGGCTLFGVRWLAEQSQYLAVHAFGSGANKATFELFQSGEESIDAVVPNLLRFGRSVVILSIHAFAHSFFWVSVTVMFLLLRKSVDSTPLDHLTGDHHLPLGDLPIVGMAASNRREAATPRTGE